MIDAQAARGFVMGHPGGLRGPALIEMNAERAADDLEGFGVLFLAARAALRLEIWGTPPCAADRWRRAPSAARDICALA